MSLSEAFVVMFAQEIVAALESLITPTVTRKYGFMIEGQLYLRQPVELVQRRGGFSQRIHDLLVFFVNKPP
ncbi:hypothetical protein MCOR27_008483 [Pyricularia oryzae]|uniref:Uncharacterized protein n=1 Tax=Pyricularia oryzae TaxID=318829 RepID=A0A4P7N6Z4_PYROR|nr:hypothetical protein MCOR01_000333 [Pyricularia oryzae]KAI6265948.1 hypothetical protein MCOR26_010462 [Pyricularia oryzae]KAI6272149.1 hypothetical protein MCOR27_008483 [Pyricularia oryzae]KAI6343946.1 hypothetical protein MCOR28_004510 [Pyricularia oryzae]KAI6350927.1 hypothetical protein MCOR31_012050 [Pyricularia oryzae]